MVWKAKMTSPNSRIHTSWGARWTLWQWKLYGRQHFTILPQRNTSWTRSSARCQRRRSGRRESSCRASRAKRWRTAALAAAWYAWGSTFTFFNHTSESSMVWVTVYLGFAVPDPQRVPWVLAPCIQWPCPRVMQSCNAVWCFSQLFYPEYFTNGYLGEWGSFWSLPHQRPARGPWRKTGHHEEWEWGSLERG